MSNMELQDVYKTGQVIVDIFLSGSKYYFSDLKPSEIPDKPGVYAIYNSSETLYVGRSKNLRQRLYRNHLMGSLSNARLKKYLIGDNDCFPDISTPLEAKKYLIEHCYLQFMQFDTVIERGRVEGLLSFALNVKYAYEEH